MTIVKGISRFFLAFGLSLASGFSQAGPVVTVEAVSSVNEQVSSRLLKSVRYHVDMAGRAVAEEQLNPSNAAKKELVSKWRSSTTARFEYRYVQEGVEHLRVYNAMSGQDLRDLLKVPQDHPLYSGFDERFAARGANAERYVKNIEVPDSRFSASLDIRQADAELKALRNLESDIRSGLVPSGGRLTGFISQAPCESCKPMLENVLPETGYVSEAHVSYLPNAREAASDLERQIANKFYGVKKNLVSKDVLEKAAAANASAEGGALEACL